MSVTSDQPAAEAFGPAETGAELDAECAAAVDLARAAAVDVARFDAALGESGHVGDHLWVRPEGERLVTHAFGAELRGYRGWYWAVTVGRADGFEPTVAEVVLLPGSEALLAPVWVPWAERVRAGDMSPGDVMPTKQDDPRLVPAYLQSDDPQQTEVGFELGVGRVRVLSRWGRLDAADRWYAGEGGPDTPMAQQAPAPCGTCGFFLAVAGSLRAGFGVCANEISPSDGRIVSVEHGCGAHSEAAVEAAGPDLGDVFDDEQIEVVSLRDVPGEPAAPAGEAAVQPAQEQSVGGEPAADLGEQSFVVGEGVAVQADGGDDARRVEAEHESAVEQVTDTQDAQTDVPAPVAGGVEESAPGDAGQDSLVEGRGEDVSGGGDDGDIAAGRLQDDGVGAETLDEKP